MQDFTPTRIAALERLNAFVPKAGRDYSAKRNYDVAGHPHVSGLSPYIRHRVLTEGEVLDATLSRFWPSTADKFIQEVYWRTYWKGWLELRPAVWDRYQTQLTSAYQSLESNDRLKNDVYDALNGQTGIDCFDHWARELQETGYLHNHARMWFASIWIFTLRLPWVLGADFFLRHLLDGDPASNTLGWRWVAGIQTRGKTYLARPDNIARYTEGRFTPSGLAQIAPPLDEPDPGPAGTVPISQPPLRGAKTAILLHYEDLSPTALMRGEHRAAAVLKPREQSGPSHASENVLAFRKALTDDAAARYGLSAAPHLSANDIANWAEKDGIEQIVTAYAPVGPVAEELCQLERQLHSKGITLSRQLRAHDTLCWPHATKGFFKFKEKIPQFLKARRATTAA